MKPFESFIVLACFMVTSGDRIFWFRFQGSKVFASSTLAFLVPSPLRRIAARSFKSYEV